MTRIPSAILRLSAVAAAAVTAAVPLATAPAAHADTGSTVVSADPAPNGIAGTTTVVQLPYDGVTRDYHVFVPTNLPSGPRPLMVALHGMNRTASDFESTTNLDKYAARLGALIVYPDALDESWNAGTCCGTSAADNVDDVGFITAAIADAAARHSIDRYRIAVAGHSNGAMMTYRYACERSDLVNVIDVISGTFVAPTCSFSRPVSLLHVHGLADPLVPFNGVATSFLDASGFPPVKGGVAGVAILDGCHGGWATDQFNGRPDVSRMQAMNCPAGTAVQLITSTPLKHPWSTGSADVQTYGVDETGATWAFDANVWAGRPAPAAL